MDIFSPEFIAGGGLLLIAFIIFAESGLLFGFFFPGDTLLFLAGALAARGQFNLWMLLMVVIASAISGGQVGYYIGKRAGPRLFKKKDGILFRHEHIERAEMFYEKHGGKTIIIARFMPVVRTFAAVVAGMGSMNYKRFTTYNIIGSTIWAIGITVLGYYFGQKIPNIDKYLLPIIGVVTIFSFASPFYHVISNPLARQKLKQRLGLNKTR